MKRGHPISVFQRVSFSVFCFLLFSVSAFSQGATYVPRSIKDLDDARGVTLSLKFAPIWDGTKFTPRLIAYGDLAGPFPTLPASAGAVTSNFLNSYNSASGVFTKAQPAFSDLSGTPTTLAGYGIIDGVANSRTVNGHPLSANVTVAYSELAGPFPTLPISLGPVTHEFLNSYNSATGNFTKGQPSAASLSDATTVGQNLITLANPGAITFPRLNADNSVTPRTAAELRTDIGAQASGSYVTDVSGTAPVVSSGGTTPAISMAASTNAVDGYLSAADHTTFNTASVDRLKWDGGATGLTAATGRTSLGLVIGTDVQAYDADLTTWAGITPGSGVSTFLATPTLANLNTAITGTDAAAAGANADITSLALTGASTNSFSGTASTSALKLSGAPYTAGSATTSKPLLLIENAATSTGWHPSGSYLGINAATGFTGRLLDLQLNGVTVFKVDPTGNTTTGDLVTNSINLNPSNTLKWGSGTTYLFGNASTGGATGTLRVVGNSTTAINLGGDTSSFPTLKRNATAVNIRLADDSADAPITASNMTASGTLAVTGASTLTGGATVPDDAYAAGWNGSTNVPTKNAVYDKIEALAPASYTYATAPVGVPFITSVTGIDAKTIAATDIFTVPSGKTFVVQDWMMVCTAVSAFTTGPTATLIESGGASAMMSSSATSTNTQNLNLVGRYWTCPGPLFATAQTRTACAAGNKVQLNITTGAIATTLTFSVSVTGFYY